MQDNQNPYSYQSAPQFTTSPITTNIINSSQSIPKQNPKKKLLIISIISTTILILVIVSSIILFSSFNNNDTQAKIDELNQEIESLSDQESDYFFKYGFSEEYFRIADLKARKQFEKEKLEASL